jgi:hypothetical protein
MELRIFEFKIPKIKKIIEIIRDQNLMFPSFNNGNMETIKKNTKKTIPKLLFVPILILIFFKLNNCRLLLHVFFVDTSNFYWFFHCVSSEWFAKLLV